MFLDMVGRAGRSQNGGTDDTKEGDVHEKWVASVTTGVLLKEGANQRERRRV